MKKKVRKNIRKRGEEEKRKIEFLQNNHLRDCINPRQFMDDFL